MRLLPLLFLFVLAGCEPSQQRIGPLQGYAPVYATASSKTVSFSAAKPTAAAGKIYAYGSYAFQVEQGKGIHIIDNSNSSAAAKVGFLNIDGCTEMAIKNGYLYTNNVNDLIVVSLANPTAPAVVNRQEGAFPAISQTFPPVANAYFECPDPAKGTVVGWELKTIDNPQCRR